MSHQDNIYEILLTLGEGWHDTKEIHDAVGDYWREQRIYVAEGKTQQYTHHSLLRLYKREMVERKTVKGHRCTYWRVRK